MNFPLATVAGIMALIGSIVAPTLWLGEIKSVNAVQANQITTLQENYVELRTEIKDMRADTNKRLDLLLQDRGLKLK